MNTDEEIVLHAQKKEKAKYAIPIGILSIGLLELMNILENMGAFRLISGSISKIIALTIWSAATLTAVYYLVYLREHTVTVKGRIILNENWNSNQKTIYISEIRSITRNRSGDIILKDENGKTLLRVEKTMSDFDKFEEYLKENNFKEI